MTEPKPSKEQRVYQLVQELEDTKHRKKASAKAFGDEIKRLNEEIKEILDEDKE